MAPLPSKAPERAASAARPGRKPTSRAPGKAQAPGKPSASGKPPAPGKAPQRAGNSAFRLTERGAVLTMAGCFLVGLLAAAWLGWPVLAGLAFVAGCVIAAWYASPPSLLTVVVSPPLLFLGAVVLVSAMTGPGGVLMGVVLGTVVTLAGTAPWLAAGMVLMLIIALVRGLPRCIRDLVRELRSG